MPGSRPGERRGGRQKGTPNKRTEAERLALAESGLKPLEYMLQVMRDESQPSDRRDDMAKAAAPYLHAKLQAATVQHSGTVTLEQLVGASLKAAPVK